MNCRRDWALAVYRPPFAPEQFEPPLVVRRQGVKLAPDFPRFMSLVARLFYDSNFERSLTEPALEKRIEALRSLYSQFQRVRALFAPENAKLRAPITDEDPNFDPYGPITREIGSESYEEFVEIGKVIAARFAGLSDKVDMLVNRVRLPDGMIVDGVRLHRGEAAVFVNDKKNDKYGFAPGDPKYFTQTAAAAARKLMFEAGLRRFADLTGWPPSFIELHDFNDALEVYADGLYLLFQSPQQNRGSDSVIRLTGVVVGRRVFNQNLRLPQDIDLRAHTMEQKAFQKWLSDQLRSQLAP